MALKLAKKTNKIQKIVKKAVPEKSAVAKTAKVKNVITPPTGQYIEAIGRRKTATARVRLYMTEGDFVVNQAVVGDYFSCVRQAQSFYMKPFEVTGTRGKYGVNVSVGGSGVRSQLDAVILGISRALVELNEEFRPLLKAEGFLTRDDRMKETRKIGMGGKARRKRQSPKR